MQLQRRKSMSGLSEYSLGGILPPFVARDIAWQTRVLSHYLLLPDTSSRSCYSGHHPVVRNPPTRSLDHRWSYTHAHACIYVCTLARRGRYWWIPPLWNIWKLGTNLLRAVRPALSRIVHDKPAVISSRDVPVAPKKPPMSRYIGLFFSASLFSSTCINTCSLARCMYAERRY